MREDLTANLVERLSAGQIDAALIAYPYDAPGVDHIEIGDDPFLLAVEGSDPLARRGSVALSDLTGVNLLLLEDGHCLRDHAIEACKLQDQAAATYSATSLFTLAQMTQAGLGATLLPKMAVDAGLARAAGLSVAPFSEPDGPARRIGVAWRRGSSRREEAELLADAFREALRALANVAAQ